MEAGPARALLFDDGGRRDADELSRTRRHSNAAYAMAGCDASKGRCRRDALQVDAFDPGLQRVLAEIHHAQAGASGLVHGELVAAR